MALRREGKRARRMWKRYAKTNPVFVWMVLKEYIKVRKSKLTADTR
jgi:UDP-N-acetyl-D-mannosaminuronic acid transferase (WecB/TagA/CpsF family)